MTPLVPAAFSVMVSGRDPEPYISGDAWLARLPRIIDESLAQWDLTLDGDTVHGRCALVLPVRRPDGSPAVLKVTWPHAEAEPEHLALQRWAGHGAVRLLAANPARWAMLLERLDGGRDLYDLPIDDACAEIGSLLRAPCSRTWRATRPSTRGWSTPTFTTETSWPPSVSPGWRSTPKPMMADPADGVVGGEGQRRRRAHHGDRDHQGDAAGVNSSVSWAGQQRDWSLNVKKQQICLPCCPYVGHLSERP